MFVRPAHEHHVAGALAQILSFIKHSVVEGGLHVVDRLGEPIIEHRMIRIAEPGETAEQGRVPIRAATLDERRNRPEPDPLMGRVERNDQHRHSRLIPRVPEVS
jgi:hypothetical protein